ncbi:MAG: glycoside hydrolase family 9 protein, partial [Candidatus Brocadiia bacterium]
DAGRVYDRIHQTLTEQPAGADVFTERHGLSGTTPEACCAVVANMAHAHMVYRRFPSQAGFAGQCLDDALLCWERLRNLEEPPVRPAFTAAALMFEATGREDTHAMVRELAPEILSTWHGHINYGNYDAGLATYALSERDEVDPDLQAELRGYYRDYADAVVKASQANGYREPMIEGVVFTWGSNGSCIAKSGAHLLMVNRFAPDPRYVETARESLHWLLGRNPVDTCMVTGHGRPPLGPIFHAMYGPSGPGLAMPPGYLAGGPTNLECPGISRHPAKCWRPDHACWELTEPSLGYQGNLNYLLGALTASPQ